MTVRHDGLTAEWLGYATLRLEGDGTVVYFDPGRYGVLTGEWEPDGACGPHPSARDYDRRDGDVVCVTHIHHYDPDGIDRVASDDATVLLYEGLDVADTDRDVAAPEDLDYHVRRVSDEADLVANDVPVWTVPAYNHADGPNVNPDGTPIHPEGIGCGFLVSVDGTRIFWPGDSDVLEGHDELDVSLFCPSIAENYTMDRHGAAELAEAMDPDLVLPIHYDTFDGLCADDETFAADVASRGVPVVLDR